MINMTTAQRVTLERRWSELDETTRPTLDRFLDSVKDTFHCDDAVVVYWAHMWLCVERDGHCHT
tara:strand:+ start:417 stop:608 length:192 start_codon:yes stop_codon:yes gene_type:complete